MNADHPDAYLDPAIPLEQIAPSPQNPNEMEPQDYQFLVRSAREEGFLDTIVVRALSTPEGTEHTVYQVLDGEHRWKAAQEAGLTHISAWVYPEGTCDDAKAKAIQVGRNRVRGRMDLTAVAEGLMEAGVGEAGLAHLAGYTDADYGDLMELLVPTTGEDLLEDDIAVPRVVEDEPPTERAAPAVFELLVVFDTVEDLKAVQKRLKKAAPGRSRNMAQGLKAVLGLD